ncbi:MAG: hypothetical protein J5379_10470 [Clostridiales bacterium]|nr:hypothetical protein [Clostridiales bacterium]
MAQKKNPSSHSRTNTHSGASSHGKAPASSRSSKSKAQVRVEEPDKEPLYVVLWSYSWGKILYLLLGILVLIGLDFLIAMNNYDRFFTVLGIEIIAAMLIGWIIYLILDRKKQKNLKESDIEEE